MYAGYHKAKVLLDKALADRCVAIQRTHMYAKNLRLKKAD